MLNISVTELHVSILSSMQAVSLRVKLVYKKRRKGTKSVTSVADGYNNSAYIVVHWQTPRELFLTLRT